MAEEAETLHQEVPGTPVETRERSEGVETPTKKPAMSSLALGSSPKAKAKGSPKTKAKGSPKSKVKASAKAKVKGSPKSNLSVKKHIIKRPAAKELDRKEKKTEEEEDNKTAKPAKTDKNKRRRQAAQKAAEKKKEEEKKESTKKKENKTGTLKRPAASESKAGKSSGTWKKGIETTEKEEKKNEHEDKEDPEEECQDFEDDTCVDPGANEIRDRSKMQKFNHMYQAGQLPAWIKEEWEKTKTMKSGKRERQSLIVNSLFDRSDQGRLLVNTDKAVFHAMKESFEERSSKQSTKSLTKRLFMGKFNLTEENFKAGLLEGEFLEIQTESGPRYQWLEDSSTFKQGDRSGFGWSMSKEGDKKEMDKVSKIMTAGSHWSKGFAMLGTSSTSGSSGSAAPLAIQDMDAPLTPEQWNMAQTQLIQAQEALSKLEKDGIKHLQVVGDNRADPVFEVLLLGCKRGFAMTVDTGNFLSAYMNMISIDSSNFSHKLYGRWICIWKFIQ